MRPPILQWKVALALLFVVAIGVTLGSVLRPKSTTVRGTLAYRIALDSAQSSGVQSLLGLTRSMPDGGSGTQVGGWTGYVPHPTLKERRMICQALRDEAGPVRALPAFCTKHGSGR